MLISISLFGLSANAQLWPQKTDDLLSETDAFKATAYIEGSTLNVSWQVANDYYMYLDQFAIVPQSQGLQLGEANYPAGVIENDPEFGEVTVYFGLVEYSVPITVFPSATDTLVVQLKGQGCNKPIGLCYPPQSREIHIQFDPNLIPAQAAGQQITGQTTEQTAASPKSSTTPGTTNSGGNAPENKSFWGYVLTAFGAGLLLSFTPCVLPMIPILAGVIAGQRSPTKLQSGWLAICYVLGTVATYAVAGWVAGATGTQLQAHFQNPWVIGSICFFLLVLAASLFGAFKIQLPSAVQTKLNTTSVNSKSASLSSFFLGLVSALVVGACVSPILILTLGAAITKGDPILGMAIMSSMALGMGSLLILFGFGAGWILPRTGAWMNNIQVLFGFMVLGVAIYIASTLPAVPALLLWAILLLSTGSYLLHFAGQLSGGVLTSVLKGIGIGTMLWGGMALVGSTLGGTDILRPLNQLQLSAGNSGANNNTEKLPFQTITTQASAADLLRQASTNGQPVLVDFYADWCLDCKRMDRTTFADAQVKATLNGWSLIKIDVTETNANSESVKKFFNVFGPPATLFYNADGTEQQNLRQYGYLKTPDFINLANQVAQ